MALKLGSYHAKMWKDFLNFHFIVITSGLLYLILLVTSEPVCYTRVSLDERNRYMKRVDCDGTDKICHRFASSEDVKLGDLLDSPCGYPEDYPSTHKNLYKAITCSTNNLPVVGDGSFDCAPNTNISKGEACTLTCNEGFYPAYSSRAVCEEDITNQGGVWSDGSFVCHAITCQEAHLPTVNAGFFNCSGYSIGDRCNLTCDDDYYPSATKYTVCKEYNNHNVNWTVGTFQCSECNDWNEWNGSEYKHISTYQTWEDSHKWCKSDSSHLVTIGNKEENEFVHTIVQRCGAAWIGLNDRNTEGTWEWSDGTVSTYRNWYEGRPNGGDAVDCVFMYRYNGEWYDWPCTYEFRAVCERNNPLT